MAANKILVMDKLWVFSKLWESILYKLSDKLMDFAFSPKNSPMLESLRGNMRRLRAIASDIDDNIKGSPELGTTKKRKRQVEEWFENLDRINNEFNRLENDLQTEGFLSQFFGGGQVAKLDASVCKLIEETLGFGEPLTHAHEFKGHMLTTNKLVGDKFLKNLDKILMYLEDPDIPIVGISGMGGVGKTTLATHVNNRLLEQSQKYVVWITVSQESAVTLLQDKMAKVVGLDLSDEDNENIRASRLNSALSRRCNTVYILDDVWKMIDFKMLGDPLSIVGCRLLITTRSRAVCHQLQCKKIIEVKNLNEDEAWNLFKERFGQATNLTREMQNIAKLMVGKCNGLPLGIITLAASMRGQSSIYVWRDALARLREQDMITIEDEVLRVLKHSFDWLGRCEGISNEYSKSQLCFLYCSLYPEDYEINREELIRKFILEGFLSERGSRKETFDVGQAVLDKLVDVCLLEKDKYSDDFVKMHDLVRDMALQITKGIHHSSVGKIPIGEEWSKEIRRMSFSENFAEIPSEMSLNSPKLVTLFSNGHCPLLRFIPDTFFLHMCNLCILDLSRTGIKKLPDLLSGLVNLKALLLQDCYDLESVPCLGKLKKLRELDLEETGIGELPQGVEELSDLRFLSLSLCGNLKMFPKYLLLKLPCLECLLLPKHIEAPVKEIMKLKHLGKFHGKVKDASEFNQLIIHQQNLSHDITVGSEDCNLNHDIEGNRLELSKYDFEKDMAVSTKGIHHLYLKNCKGLNTCLVESLLQLNIDPKSIESLYIFGCHEIECLQRINRGAIASLPLPLLPPAFFSSLSHLRISKCRNMKKLGLPASHLVNLKLLEIWDCEMIEEILEVNEEEASKGVVSLPKLTSFSLIKLPRPKSICNATLACSSIKSFRLIECGSLEKLALVSGQVPDFDSPPHLLEKIEIREKEKEWWDKLELGHSTHHSLLQPFIHYLCSTR